MIDDIEQGKRNAFSKGMVCVDVILGVDSTIFPVGTPSQPTSTIANALVIAAARNLTQIHLRGGGFTIPADLTTIYSFFGERQSLYFGAGSMLDLNGKNIGGSYFRDLVITGTVLNEGFFENCTLTLINDFWGDAVNCILLDTIKPNTASKCVFTKCTSEPDLGASVTIDATKTPNYVKFVDFKGAMIIKKLIGGTINIYASAGATITIENTCTGGTINIYGNANITDNSLGCAVNDYTMIASIGNPTADMSDVSPSDIASNAEYLMYMREQIRGHVQTRIGLVIPSIANIATDTPNSALFSLLSQIGTPNYIDQTGVDAGQQNWSEYDIIVVGSDANHAFVLANIDDLITVHVPTLVVSSAVAIHLKMGHNGVADTGSVTNIYIETRDERVVELLIEGGHFTGVGDQTIFSAGAVSSRLNMSDAQLTESLISTVGGGAGGTNAETVVGELPYSSGNGVVYTLDDGTELPSGRIFAGCFLHAESLNAAGEEYLRRMCLNLTQSSTTTSLELKANAAKINRIWGETYAGGLAQGAGSILNNAQCDSLIRAIADILRVGGSGDAAAIMAKTDLMNSDSGSATITGTDSDTIVPSSLPTKMHLTLDINALVANGADNTIEIKVGAGASERVVAYYNLTGDGAGITADTGSGVGAIIKQRKIDISNILVYTGEQVIIANTKNDAGGDLAIPYKYLCGV